MPHVYISYHRKEVEAARYFAEQLTGAGISIWLDILSVERNRDWDSQIRQAIDTAECVLLLMSPNAANSAYLLAEWQYILEKKLPIIPVTVRPFSPRYVPYDLQRLQFVNATDHKRLHEAAEAIIKVIQQQIPLQISGNEIAAQNAELEQMVQQADTIMSQPERNTNIAALLAEGRKHQHNHAVNKAVSAYTEILLDRGEPEYRLQAIAGLADLRAASSDLIQAASSDPAPEVRRAAIRALAHFHGTLTSEALQIAAVSDPDLEVRLYAALIELYFKQPHQVSSWLAALAGSRHDELRSAAGNAQLFANELTKSGGHVFISYSRQDAEAFTLQLVETLRSREKFKIWIDTNLTPGTESWKKGIAKAIEQCSLQVVILSPAVHESKWIGEEVSYAEQLGKDRLYVKYTSTHMPFGMSEMQGLRSDLTFADYPDEMLEALIVELKRRKIPLFE